MQLLSISQIQCSQHHIHTDENDILYHEQGINFIKTTYEISKHEQQ